MRDGSQTLLERAFELAGSGQVLDIKELRYRLGREGYDASQITGATLVRQLREAINQNRPPHSPGRTPSG